MTASAAIHSSAAQSTSTISGTVFNDFACTGVQHPNAQGIAGVLVSNGVEVAVTDLAGHWHLPEREGCEVFVIKPHGWALPVRGNTTNAVSIRRFFERVANVVTTEATGDATIIQTRHRIPEQPLVEGQVLVYQVPQPEPLRKLEPSEAETRRMHAWAEYGLMHVRLYEDIARYGHAATTYSYPVLVNGRHVMSPSPIPKFDNPKMNNSPALQLFGAGREKRIYALPPWTEVKSLDFEDHPFEVQKWDQPCALCGTNDSYLDEVIIDDAGGKMFVCSDSHYCETRRTEGHRGHMLGSKAGSLLSDEPRGTK